MATKPSEYLTWTDGSVGKVTEPSSGKKLLGWEADERPPFQYFNWLFWLTDQWIQWLDQQTSVPTLPVTNVTHAMSPYTVLSTDRNLECDCTAGAIVLTLPDETLLAGKPYSVKKVDVSANTVTINGATSPSQQYLDGATSQTLTQQYEGLSFYGNHAQTGWSLT